MPLLFLDLETTGLNPDVDVILEVAALIVSDDLATIVKYRDYGAVAWDGKTPAQIDPVVVAMHTFNGLWAECLATGDTAPDNIAEVDDNLAQVILERPGDVQLAGNSVHFDRAFMKVHMPKSYAKLHHRQLDLSSLNEAARRWWPEIYAARPQVVRTNHRALTDVEASLELARYYKRAIGPAVVAPVAAPPPAVPTKREPKVGDRVQILAHHAPATLVNIGPDGRFLVKFDGTRDTYWFSKVELLDDAPAAPAKRELKVGDRVRVTECCQPPSWRGMTGTLFWRRYDGGWNVDIDGVNKALPWFGENPRIALKDAEVELLDDAPAAPTGGAA